MTLRLAGFVAVGLVAATTGFSETPADTPYRRDGQAPLEFRGPGRDTPEPNPDEVAIGWFGPADADHPDFGDFWRGALLALEAENAAGGYRGAPFRLRPAWSESPWQAGIGELTRLVYDEGAWAVIGGVDGATTHLAEQVALKARFPLVSPGSTDATANCGHVPWLFTGLPSDERQAPVLVERLRHELGHGALAVVAGNDHDSHAALVALRREIAAQRVSPATLVEWGKAEAIPGPLAERLLEVKPKVVLVIAPAREAAEIVVALRQRGFRGPILGGATLARNAFGRTAGASAEGVIVPLLREASPEWDAFARAYEARWHEAPDAGAAQAHDAVRLLASAVRAGGLNRVRIVEALRALAPWSGAAGSVRWDALGGNLRPVGLARWQGGRLVPFAG
jgi:branched-chain amino acid transport system substrate-binding protein